MRIVDVSKAIDAYRDGEWTLDQFADWLRVAARRKFSETPEVLAALLEIDSMFSRIDFDGLSEASFREELANAVRPFVRSKFQYFVVRPQELTLEFVSRERKRTTGGPVHLGTNSQLDSRDFSLSPAVV
jgi:hypothetical protein